MSTKYALKVRKSDLPLITLLNDGTNVIVKKKPTYFVFEIDDYGNRITTRIVTERELAENYEIGGNSPLLLRLKK